MEIFPVVQIDDDDTDGSFAVSESGLAFKLGADGIYLTDHNNRDDTDRLFEIYNKITEEFPERFIGLNIYNIGPFEVMRAIGKAIWKKDGLHKAPSGLWVNDMRNSSSLPTEAIELKRLDYRLKSMKLIGGIAINHTEDPSMALYEAVYLSKSVDIVAVDGPVVTPSLAHESYLAIRRVIGDKPLAVVDLAPIQNIADYRGVVNQMIVSKTVETFPGSGNFDKKKLKELTRLAHSFAA